MKFKVGGRTPEEDAARFGEARNAAGELSDAPGVGWELDSDYLERYRATCSHNG